jgi:hypothetical protein
VTARQSVAPSPIGALLFGARRRELAFDDQTLVLSKAGHGLDQTPLEAVTVANEGQIQWEGSAKVTVFIPAGSKMTWHGTVIGYPEVYVTTLHPK